MYYSQILNPFVRNECLYNFFYHHGKSEGRPHTPLCREGSPWLTRCWVKLQGPGEGHGKALKQKLVGTVYLREEKTVDMIKVHRTVCGLKIGSFYECWLNNYRNKGTISCKVPPVTIVQIERCFSKYQPWEPLQMLQAAWGIITLHVKCNRKERCQSLQWQAVSWDSGFRNACGTPPCFRGFVDMRISGKITCLYKWNCSSNFLWQNFYFCWW